MFDDGIFEVAGFKSFAPEPTSPMRLGSTGVAVVIPAFTRAASAPGTTAGVPDNKLVIPLNASPCPKPPSAPADVDAPTA